MNEQIGSESQNIFIGLGSNLEPRLEYMKAAVSGLQGMGNIVRISSVYETDPVGGIPQHDYLNVVAELHTQLGPLELITQLKALEKLIGRKDRPRWHEREIDLDLLFYGDLILDTAMLTLPHPEIQNRAFVLVPMCEIAPYFQHPVSKKSVTELLRSVDATSVRITTLTL